MLNKKEIEEKMQERGFTSYAVINNTQIQFISAHMYDYKIEVSKREQMPVINVVVNLETEEFYCLYNVPSSINMLKTPICGSVMNDKHFDRIVSKFELHAKRLMGVILKTEN